MPKFWTEPFDAARHHCRMYVEGDDRPASSDARLDPHPVYFVRVCSFTFEFHSIRQVEACLAYFSQKVRPSSRVPWYEPIGGDHFERQRWYERLPMWLLEEPKRLAVLKSLGRALTAFKGSLG
jgi:hypothetical protein